MPRLNLDDTIAAISTPLGEGGIGVVRLSGKKAISIADAFFAPADRARLREVPSHTCHYGHWVDSKGQVVDQVVVTVFREPRSYTREDMVEISAHGGILVTRKILETLVRAGARLAEPGEFTKRAFLNGRIDLTQAEAVLDLIRAKSDASLEAAVRQLSGTLSLKMKNLKEKTLRLTAYLEAYVDFPDEDIEVFSDETLLKNLDEILDEVTELIQSYDRGAILREGLLAVILGRPNVGKSSLLNAFLDRDRALVSEIPGTTRDILEEMIQLDGLLIRLADTAGIRSSPDAMEKMGIEKAREWMREAKLFLMVLDASEPLTENDREIYREIREKNHILVLNKIDLPMKLDLGEAQRLFQGEPFIRVSAKTREGLEVLEGEMVRRVGEKKIEGEASAISRLRHKVALEGAREALGRARKALADMLSLEFVAVDLRQALHHMGEVIGEIYTDDILEVIFREFCIGK